MYQLVFDGYLDRLLHHRGVRRRECVIWHPTREAAEQAAARMASLGQAVSVQALPETGRGASRGKAGEAGLADGGPLVVD